MEKIIIDTSVFMGALQRVEELLGEYDLIVPYVVLKELEKHKDNYKDAKRSYLGRTAIKFISSNAEYFSVVEMDGVFDTNDDEIIAVAEQENGIIATQDISMKYKCATKGIRNIKVSFRDDDFKGSTTIDVSDEPYCDMFSKLCLDRDVNVFGLEVNEYLIIKSHGVTKDIWCWDGNTHRDLKLPPKDIIEPLNDSQRCALDLLYSDDIPVKIISGTYGSGKTKLSTAIGYHKVMDKNLYSRLLMVRNTDISEEGDIGFLPGTFEDKTDLLFQTMYQHLPQTIDTAMVMKRNGLLETHIPYFMKGLSLSGFMIVDEAEDLTKDDIKKIGTRIEEDSALVLCGDWGQAKGKFVTDNGMRQLIHNTKDNPLVGTVFLDEVVRSRVSEIFAEL